MPLVIKEMKRLGQRHRRVFSSRTASRRVSLHGGRRWPVLALYVDSRARLPAHRLLVHPGGTQRLRLGSQIHGHLPSPQPVNARACRAARLIVVVKRIGCVGCVGCPLRGSDATEMGRLGFPVDDWIATPLARDRHVQGVWQALSGGGPAHHPVAVHQSRRSLTIGLGLGFRSWLGLGLGGGAAKSALPASRRKGKSGTQATRTGQRAAAEGMRASDAIYLRGTPVLLNLCSSQWIDYQLLHSNDC